MGQFLSERRTVVPDECVLTKGKRNLEKSRQ